MKKPALVKVPVTEHALLQRLNRHLVQLGQQIRKSRRPVDSNTGAYYCIDIRHNLVQAAHVDLERWAREIGVLRQWEVVADGR